MKKNTLRHMVNEAKKCPGIGLCKLDFLDTGICPAGTAFKYVAYYPEGRLRLFRHLVEGRLPLTPKLVEIAESCQLCGICDKQCYYQVEIRVHEIMKALKQLVAEKKETEEFKEIEEDECLAHLREVLGHQWAENDPGVTAAYVGGGPAVFFHQPIPKYVVLPGNSQQVADIVRLAKKYNIPYHPRASGTIGMTSPGILLDFHRMDKIEIDSFNYTAAVGPGVMGYSALQKSLEQNLRPNFGQPGSCICSNQIFNGIMTFFQTRYPSMGDNYISAEIVTPDGDILRTQETSTPSFLHFGEDISYPDKPFHYLCTEQRIKLHEVPEDQVTGLIGFSNLEEAMNMSRLIAKRHMAALDMVINARILLWICYFSFELCEKIASILSQYLNVNYIVAAIGHEYEIEALRHLAPDNFIEEDLFGLFLAGHETYFQPKGKAVLESLCKQPLTIKAVFVKLAEFLLREINTPPNEIFANIAPPDLQDFFRQYYLKDNQLKMGDQIIRLINASKVFRKGKFISQVFITPIHDFNNVFAVDQHLKDIAKEFDLFLDFLLFIPFEHGKYAQFEYDFFYNPNDKKETRRMKKVFFELQRRVAQLKEKTRGIIAQGDYIYRGLNKKENIIYNEKFQQ
ncbi:MAG: FAD-binding protein [Candidatus Aminicenantes bacterium]|nr:MAG: FAD-binding protein [Candidatus Aminicenantes bacterium]